MAHFKNWRSFFLILSFMSFGQLGYVGLNAYASTLESISQLGSSLFSESVSGSGSVDRAKWVTDWNLGYSYQKQSAPGPAPGLDITETTHEFQAGLVFNFSQPWSLSAQVTVQDTPEEFLSGRGLELGFGYSLRFKEKLSGTASSAEGFTPGMAFKFLGSLTFQHRSAQFEKTQYLTYSQSGKSKIATAQIPEPDLNVPQFGVGGSISYLPVEWLTLHGSYTKYFYNSNLSSLLDSLDNPNLKQGAEVSNQAANLNSGFASGVSAFSNFSLSGGIEFYFWDSWSWSSTASVSQSAADGTLSHTYKSLLVDDLNSKWSLGAGYEIDLNTAGVSRSEIVSFSYQL